jgi:membrane protease YdiL (CAAX protease family)
MLLVIASALYSRLISFVGSNDNQNAAVNLIANYPLFGILIIAFVGPICEEFTYRLGLFSFLSRIGRRKAYIISSLIFALMHFNFANPDILVEILNLPPYIISGLILTYTYEKYGFEAAITTHIFNNLFSTISIIIGVNA